MKTLRLLLPFIIGVSAVALRAADSATAADIAKLQGEWSMVSGTADGNPVPDMMLKTARRVCKGNETTVTLGEQLLLKAKFTLDPTKSPKTIDYEAIDGPTKGQTHLGIYEFDGDKVKFCFGQPGAERPKDFASTTGDRRTSTVWKRAASTDKK
jgi:uncharacterized protein (TIGR03067 family)